MLKIWYHFGNLMFEKVELGKTAFKALASDTRIDILKKLCERRKTVSELSREMGIEKSAILKHLEKLAGAELVNRVENANEFVYYEVTIKGRGVIYQNEKIKVVIVLASSLLAFAGGAVEILKGIKILPQPKIPVGTPAPTTKPPPVTTTPPDVSLTPSLLSAELVAGAVLIVIALGLSYYAFRRWQKYSALTRN